MALMIDHCPIDRLPTETLSNVFLLAIRPIRPRLYRTTSALAKLTVIAAVSKRWRFVVDGAPELWSFLHSADPIEITRMALQKSKDTSLTITCIQYQYPKADKSRVATRFIDCVTPQIERWRFAFFRAASAILRRIPSAAAPRLRSVTFHCQGSDFMLDNPFGGQAPQLRELVCMRTGFRWNSGLLVGLSSLRINLEQNEQLSIRCTELYAALANSPNLQALVITQPTWPTDEPDVLNGVPTLHFPYLTEIKLCAPSEFTNTILAHIEAPLCSTFRTEADVESTELLDRLVPYLPKFINNRPLESWKAELYVEEERMGFTLSPAHKAFTVWQPFDLELYGDWPSTFSWIIDKLLPSTTTRFPMSIHFSEGCEFFEYVLQSVLLRLPCVQQLTLEHAENPEVVWGWLAEPTQHKGTPQWLFPQLRKLETYGGGYDWDVLVDMVSNRWGPDDDRELEPPESLERLRLIGSDLTDEQMESLKEVIGDENVTVDYSDGETDSAESDWKADLLL